MPYPAIARITVTSAAISLLALTSAGAQAPPAGRIELSVDVSKTGPKIDRNLFGQFAEHLGKGIYEGVWVGPDNDSERLKNGNTWFWNRACDPVPGQDVVQRCAVAFQPFEVTR